MGDEKPQADSGAAPRGDSELPKPPKPGRELGSHCKNRSGPKRVKLLRPAMFAALASYTSTRNSENVGVAAFLEDMLVLDPRWFLAQLARLEPKSVTVDTTERSFKVVMLVDGAQPLERLGSDTQARLTDTPNATYHALSDVVLEADKAEALPQRTTAAEAPRRRTTGGGALGRETGPIHPPSRPSTAPPPETARPLPPHISKPSEVVSDFSDFKHVEPMPPWHPNCRKITRCPRCGAPVEYKGLVRNLPSYEHPVKDGEPVLIRQWAKCPNQE